MDAGYQVVKRSTSCQHLHDLLLCPDRTDVAYSGRVPAPQRHLTELFHPDPQGISDYLKESSRTGSTLVIHDKIDRTATLYPYSLAVLPPNINYCPRLRKNTGHPSCMAGNFSDLPISKGDIDSSIARRYHKGNRLKREACLFECLLHDLVGKPSLFRTSRTNNRGYNPPVHDHHLGHGGADI